MRDVEYGHIVVTRPPISFCEAHHSPSPGPTPAAWIFYFLWGAFTPNLTRHGWHPGRAGPSSRVQAVAANVKEICGNNSRITADWWWLRCGSIFVFSCHFSWICCAGPGQGAMSPPRWLPAAPWSYSGPGPASQDRVVTIWNTVFEIIR